MIKIKKSPTADTRTCDFSQVSKETLIESSKMHIEDVQKGLALLSEFMIQAGRLHDFTKLEDIDTFHKDFKNGFRTVEWWNNHVRTERHHLTNKEGIPTNVNLMDVMEYIVDCVMAGKARSGRVYKVDIDAKVLKRAFDNTFQLMVDSVEVEE